jgi:hypothetical protein
LWTCQTKGDALLPSDQINVTNRSRRASTHGGCNSQFPSQIWQPHIGPEAFNQILLSILPCPSAFRARQADNFTGIFMELKRAGHFPFNQGTRFCRAG